MLKNRNRKTILILMCGVILCSVLLLNHNIFSNLSTIDSPYISEKVIHIPFTFGTISR